MHLEQFASSANADVPAVVPCAQFASSEGLKELLRLYDEQGAAAFEDAPGTWIRARNEKGEHTARAHQLCGSRACAGLAVCVFCLFQVSVLAGLALLHQVGSKEHDVQDTC